MESFQKSSRLVAVSMAILTAMSLSACGKGSRKNVKIDGVIGPNVAFVDNKFTLSVVLEKVEFDGGLMLPIPHLEDSYLEIGPDFQSNGLLVAIGIDVRALSKLVKEDLYLLDPSTLPGGRPLPGVIQGQLPGVAVEVPKLRHTVFYFREDVFGVFIPVKLPLKEAVATFRFYDDAGNRIGNISLVGKDSNQENSGFLLLINIQGQVARLMRI